MKLHAELYIMQGSEAPGMSWEGEDEEGPASSGPTPEGEGVFPRRFRNGIPGETRAAGEGSRVQSLCTLQHRLIAVPGTASSCFTWGCYTCSSFQAPTCPWVLPNMYLYIVFVYIYIYIYMYTHTHTYTGSGASNAPSFLTKS